MKPIITVYLALTIASVALSQEGLGRDYVPDSQTAIAIAEAVLIPVYGKGVVESERPYKATLNGDVWTVAGTLRCADGKPESYSSHMCVGGVAEVKMSKRDAHIIAMTHYK